ncbi:hypothetical protein EON81_29260 [bacterium]|nr:MAG: hypothetical protein EON81_29260 [bacterium]
MSRLRQLWFEGEFAQAKTLIAQAAERAGPKDRELMTIHEQLLVRSGDWKELQAWSAANLVDDPWSIDGFHLALATAELQELPQSVDTFLHGWLLSAPELGPEESWRIYPPTAEGRRRLLWHGYFLASFRYSVLMEDSNEERGRMRLVVRKDYKGNFAALTWDLASWHRHHADWISSAAWSRFPDDPLLALDSVDNRPDHTRFDPYRATVKEVEDETHRRRQHFAPALQRLRPEDTLYKLIQASIAGPNLEAERRNSLSNGD